MTRTPFPAAPSPATPPAPATPAARQPGTPIGGPIPGAAAAPRPALNERRTLVVGRGISVQGTVQDAERLVVEGTVESSLIAAAELSVAQGGVFRGAVEVEDAEVAGTIDGTLTARGNLIVRATGRLIGTAKCRRLQVEDGGQVSGHLEMITGDAPKPAEPARTPSEAPSPAAAPAPAPV
ncbi:cytoskeletal protein CcmA (bactofilin family) [Endobacter medicaginis]|uniref:Cytoskeletal protein CcmA (Bactofilin family) n=2 Tax=Endobacter medicaginis TaxID=1181271 RepID=A0A839V2S3_9PROT|nr:cytoskeletal protein CcmA (bactofilin family) [Endobacter medicaginis]